MSAEVPPSPGAHTSFEDHPLSRQEYIAALVHLYRGELARANVWRTRLDTTTNWWETDAGSGVDEHL